MPETDLLFVDSWHVYARTSRELAALHGRVRWRIVLHDTTVDEWLGESLRMGMDFVEQARRTGYPISESPSACGRRSRSSSPRTRPNGASRSVAPAATGSRSWKGSDACETRVIPATVAAIVPRVCGFNLI